MNRRMHMLKLAPNALAKGKRQNRSRQNELFENLE